MTINRLNKKEVTRMDCYVCQGHGELICNEDLHYKSSDTTSCSKCSDLGYVICHRCEGIGFIEVID
jgi:DnaJ-class molecular chaperone